MMDDEDLMPQHVAPKSAPKNLALMSIEALREHIAALEAEIARAKAAVAEKEAARASADSVFRG